MSSQKQHDDLVRQVADMRERFPNADIVKDIGSGLNFRRKGLQALLRRLLQGDKFTLVVAHRDRLCRFGFELIEYMFEQNGGEVMVLDSADVSPQRELTEDLLAVLTRLLQVGCKDLRRYEKSIKENKDYPTTDRRTSQ